MKDFDEVYVPHVGWLVHQPPDDVGEFLREGWFEYKEQAVLWLYLRKGDTFIDGGAHFGLYTALAAAAMENEGAILAVEPNPGTLPFLETNLRQHAAASARVLPLALSAAEGTTTFYPVASPKAAYSAMLPETGGSPGILVETTTLDSLVQKFATTPPSLIKLDVEGFELEVLRGAGQVLASGASPLWMIEFAELNLRRFDRHTDDLFEALRSHGYLICSFDENTLQLKAQHDGGPVWYDNFFVTRELEPVNQRLREAPDSHRRIAVEILKRGAACARLRASEGFKRAEEADRRADEHSRRADEANSRADSAAARLEEAYARVGEATWRAEQANQRVDEAARRLDEAYKKVGEARWLADEANRRAERAERENAQLTASLREVRLALQRSFELLSTLQSRFRAVLSSGYVQLGGKLRLCKTPLWVDELEGISRRTEALRDSRTERPSEVAEPLSAAAPVQPSGT